MNQNIWLNLPVYLQILTIGFAAFWLLQILYISLVRMRPFWRNRKERMNKVPISSTLPPISIVIYAHNQGDELQRTLPQLLQLQYPDFEVIVVDDASTDNTEDILRLMDQRSDHFFHTTISELSTVSRHKFAMLLGVKAAHNDIVLMTHAQCVPVSPYWLHSIGRLFVPGVDAVVGPVAYGNQRGIIKRYYQWDFFDRMVDMLGLTGAIQTYGGLGFNLAFRKEVFFADHNHAIQSHLNLHPGEDDLFLKEISRKGNVCTCCSAEAVIVCQQRSIHYGWFQERLKRAFTQQRYFLFPTLVKHVDVVSRLACWGIASAVAYDALAMEIWWLSGTVLGMLLLQLILFVTASALVAKALGLRRFYLLPLIAAVITPVVDLCLRIRVMRRNTEFYVGRIDRKD